MFCTHKHRSNNNQALFLEKEREGGDTLKLGAKSGSVIEKDLRRIEWMMHLIKHILCLYEIHNKINNNWNEDI